MRFWAIKKIPAREGGIEIVVEKLSTRMATAGHDVACFNKKGKHVSGAKVERKKEYKGVKIKEAFTIDKKGFAAMTSSLSTLLHSRPGMSWLRGF